MKQTAALMLGILGPGAIFVQLNEVMATLEKMQTPKTLFQMN